MGNEEVPKRWMLSKYGGVVRIRLIAILAEAKSKICSLMQKQKAVHGVAFVLVASLSTALGLARGADKDIKNNPMVVS